MPTTCWRNSGTSRPATAWKGARAAARKSLEIDPRLAEGHVALAAMIEAYDWDWAGAEREYKRALQLSPGLETGAPVVRHVPARSGQAARRQCRNCDGRPSWRLTRRWRASTWHTDYWPRATTPQHWSRRSGQWIWRRIWPAHRVAWCARYGHRARPRMRRRRWTRAVRSASGNPHALSLVACELARMGHREESLKLGAELESLSRQPLCLAVRPRQGVDGAG